MIDVETDAGNQPLRGAAHDRLDPHRQDHQAGGQFVAAVRRGPREGTLIDAAAETEFVSLLMAKLYSGETVEAGGLHLVFRPTSVFRDAPPPAIQEAHAVNREQSNTTVIVDADYVVKLFRRVKPGIHPEAEMGHFLTDIAGYSNSPALLGSIELTDDAGTGAVAVVHRFVENQGDAWSVTNDYLDRYIDDQRVLSLDSPADNSELIAYAAAHADDRTAHR